LNLSASRTFGRVDPWQRTNGGAMPLPSLK
jgi:hypothetical protein